MLASGPIDASDLPSLSRRSRKTNAMALYAKPAHKAAARMLGYVLTLGDSGGWSDFATLLAARLATEERAELAFASLRTLEAVDADEVMRAVAEDGRMGMPLPPFKGVLDEAIFWADRASSEEVEAYCLATFLRMRANRQVDFIDFVTGRRAA